MHEKLLDRFVFGEIGTFRVDRNGFTAILILVESGSGRADFSCVHGGRSENTRHERQSEEAAPGTGTE